MGYTHFDKVDGVNGLFVGANGSEVQVASSTGQLYQSNTAITATAAQLNRTAVTTAGTVEASKVVVVGANKNVDVLAVADLKIGAGAGTSITRTAADINALATLTGAEALTNKTITAIAGSLKEVSHDYAGAAADWVLSATEKEAFILKVTNANAGCAIVGPSESRIYLLDNQSGQACTIKKAAGTGISVASTKRAIVWYNGTDYVRITPDA